MMELEPYRLIEQSDVHLFLAQATMYDIPSSIVVNEDDVLMMELNPIPVIDENDEEVGWANIYIRDHRVIAEIRINYASSERLDAQVNTMYGYPGSESDYYLKNISDRKYALAEIYIPFVRITHTKERHVPGVGGELLPIE